MTVLRFGLTPKMRPVSPRRAAVVAGLDIGTSKVVCLIARLEPQAPQDVLRRRSHGVSLLAFAHTAASGMKGGSVVDLVEAEETVRQALDIAESMFAKKDDTPPDEPADRLYNEGLYLLNSKKDARDAVKKFEEVDRQHPYSEWARKSLLMTPV